MRTRREGPEGLVVLMPAALNPSRQDRLRPDFSRWTWADSWPNAEVVAIADPAMQQAPELNGAWFIHPDHDVISRIVAFVRGIAVETRVPLDRIIFYGSSLGGFGAIACAAELVGARAVAEIPQIDVRRWQPLATTFLERYIMKMPIDDYYAIKPEQISLKDRILRAGVVPSFLLVTNDGDKIADQHRDFAECCEQIPLPRLGTQRLMRTVLVDGHKPLPRSAAIRLVRP